MHLALGCDVPLCPQPPRRPPPPDPRSRPTSADHSQWGRKNPHDTRTGKRGGPSASNRKCRITCCHGNRWHSQHSSLGLPPSSLPSPAITAKGYVSKLSVVGINTPLSPTRNVPRDRRWPRPSWPGHKVRKNAEANARRTVFLFFKGHGQYPCVPLGLEPHWPLFSHISWSLVNSTTFTHQKRKKT